MIYGSATRKFDLPRNPAKTTNNPPEGPTTPRSSAPLAEEGAFVIDSSEHKAQPELQFRAVRLLLQMAAGRALFGFLIFC